MVHRRRGLLLVHRRLQSDGLPAAGTESTQRIPSHIKLVFSRKYAGEGQTLDNYQLMWAVESHAGFLVNGDEFPRPSQTSRTPSFKTPNRAAALHRTTKGRYKPEMPRHISLALVAG